MFRIFKKSSGFTLIELLVVISIIGALAGLSMVSFSSSQKQARDTQRKNDIKQYQSLLTSYASRNKGFYPVQLTSANATSSCSTLTGSASGCPDDPKVTTQGSYKFCSNTSGSSYAVWGTLESASTTSYFVACGNGKVGTVTALPTCGAAFNCQLP